MPGRRAKNLRSGDLAEELESSEKDMQNNASSSTVGA
jgi:hypothetical protein